MTLRKARKNHQCTACGGIHTIYEGEWYFRGKTGVKACYKAYLRNGLDKGEIT